jgi:hypothetical protein
MESVFPVLEKHIETSQLSVADATVLKMAAQ